MLKEFAVDPEVIAASWEDCRHIAGLFGPHKGRLIARFPRTWKQLVFDAIQANMGDGLKKERAIQQINDLKNSTHLVSLGRPYLNPDETWLNNALLSHQEAAFEAIISGESIDGCAFIVDELDENTEPLLTPISREVSRAAHSLAQCAHLILKSGKHFRYVDPYFDPAKVKWRNSLGAFLSLVPKPSEVVFEVHALDQGGRPSLAVQKERARELSAVIPDSCSVKIILWKETDRGERFHRRLFMSQHLGLSYEGGLDEGPAGHTTDVFLMDIANQQSRWNQLNSDSTAYELVTPVLVVLSDGSCREESNF
ncbi:MAG: hypothetical protein JAZ06_09230 [Candidatus Thiodiazotropha taylori]|nr:hypothetical protein [Candidatus Thiodiazotropha taylori]